MIAAIIAIYVLLVVANWKLFEKAGYEGWKAIIPLYNTYIQFEFAWGKGLLFLLMFIPIVNIIIMILFDIKLAHAFGQPNAFAVGLIFLPFIFQLILGFGDAQYIGPDGKAQNQTPYQAQSQPQQNARSAYDADEAYNPYKDPKNYQ